MTAASTTTVVTLQVLQLVTGFLPPWYTDSEVERVEWMNKVLKKVRLFCQYLLQRR